MKRILKGLGFLVGALFAIALAAVLYIFIASERVVARTYDVPLTSFDAPSDRESVQRGKRIATIIGCTACHGAQMEGAIMFDKPNIARIAAPNLTNVVKEYTDAELERLIRHGVKRDGRSLWVMPSAMFNHLTDEDLAAVIAYVRSAPERDGVGREMTMRALGRLGIATEKFKPVASEVNAGVQRTAPDYTDPMSHGRYLVMNACTECHGQKLQGSEFLQAPNLLIAAAYSEAGLAKLLHTGVALGERKLGLMSRTSARFTSLTEQETHAIYTYLRAYVQQGGTALP
jgi:mono/diheme cytochrome c family protein